MYMMADLQLNSFAKSYNNLLNSYNSAARAVTVYEDSNILKSYLYKLYLATKAFYHKSHELQRINDRILNSGVYDVEQLKRLTEITTSYVHMSHFIKEIF